MSVLVDAARLIANLGMLGQEFVGVDSPGFSGEYLAATASSMAGDGLAATATVGKMIGPRLYQWRLDRMTGGLMTERNEARYKAASDAGKSTDLILWTLTIVEVLELTTGFGPPTEGDALKDGSQQFAALHGRLKSALPNIDSWEGSASEAYAGLDQKLQELAQTMATLDLELAAVVKDQADWVTHMRLGFGILKNLLIAAYAIEWAIKLLVPAPGNVAASQTFAITVSALGITIAVGMLTNLCTWSFLNAKKADVVASKYAEAAAGTMQKGSLAEAEVAEAGQSTVSSFDAISSSMSGMSAVSETPTAASPPTANGSGRESAPLGALSDEGETPSGSGAPAAAGVPETPDKAPPPTPTAPMPTVSQLAQMSGQASKLSGQLSQHANLVNQAMGQIQQLAQMGQQGQGAAAPAEEAARAEDVESAGADAGTAGAERAPIDVATAGSEGADQRARIR